MGSTFPPFIAKFFTKFLRKFSEPPYKVMNLSHNLVPIWVTYLSPNLVINMSLQMLTNSVTPQVWWQIWYHWWQIQWIIKFGEQFSPNLVITKFGDKFVTKYPSSPYGDVGMIRHVEILKFFKLFSQFETLKLRVTSYNY